MPDVALVGLGESSKHALELISQIVQEAACPVIAILESQDPEFVDEAAKRGIFAYLTQSDPEELQAPSTSSCVASRSSTAWKARLGAAEQALVPSVRRFEVGHRNYGEDMIDVHRLLPPKSSETRAGHQPHVGCRQRVPLHV
jgi:CheY-like chemotaxis protein